MLWVCFCGAFVIIIVMNLSVGIVGLPNVGKSTLFNALLKKQAAFVANYPFATIEPNIGVVPVPDERLEKLAEIVAVESFGHLGGAHSVTPEESLLPPSEVFRATRNLPPIVPATVKFVDIAGLVKGASEGAGLGNKFLSHIREVSIIAHVVRAFVDENVIREGSAGVKEDYQTIQMELMLADIQTLENSKRKSQKSKPQLKSQNLGIEKALEGLNSGVPVRDVQLSDEEREEVKPLFLLTTKPEIVVLNVAEQALKDTEQITQNYAEVLEVSKDKIVLVSAKIEAELAELSEDEQKEYLANLGLKESGLERLIKKAYDTLGLISFLTAGEKEVRAWTIEKGTKAIDAAGVIHTDFEKNFIKAEVVSFEDFINPKGPASPDSPASRGGWKGAREAGKARFEGRNYVMKDGDVVEFKIGI